MKNVLIVEDESIVALEIENYVSDLGYKVVSSVSNAKDALEIAIEENITLILMDVHIKGNIDGIECAKSIKEVKNIPIIYISAFSDDETLERAIATKPSSYLVKPFNRQELKVAMTVALNSYESHLRIGDIVFDYEFSFDTQAQELILYGEVIHLTKQEKDLLALLVNSKNQVVSIYKIENEIWPDKGSNENTRRALIRRVRSKLNYKFIETLHSIGYKINI
jgi:DNA-binding response OmpR family regulator